MPVSIDGLDLIGADESTVESEGQLEATSVPTQGADETIIVSLTAEERPQLAGLATGIRLSAQAGYASDPHDALAEWVQEFVSLITAEQGVGWSVTDDERSRTLTVTATSASWTFTQGAPFEVRWSLDLVRGENVSASTTRSPTTATPQTSPTLDGVDLGSIREKRTEVSVDVDVTPLALSPTSETVVVPQSGVVRQITIAGTVGGAPADLRDTDDTIRGLVGDDQQVTYQTAFPGTSHDVVVSNWDSTMTAGEPATMQYGLELVEGITF